MCNLAKVEKTESEGWAARGDPTECAIQVLAHRFDWGREKLAQGVGAQWGACRSTLVDYLLADPFHPFAVQLSEFPFDSDAKRMSVIFTRISDE